MASRQVADATLELAFACQDPARLPFRPGQFISLACGAERRSYSIASATTADRFTVVAKLVDGGLGSHFLAALRPGVEVGFTGPMGFFVPEREHPGEIVFAATGAGFGPVVPMLYQLLGRPGPAVHVHWGARRPGDLFYLGWLDALAAREARLRVTLHLTQPGPLELLACRLAPGRLTAPVLAEATTLPHPTFYLVGRGDMIKEVTQGLVAAGIDRKRQIRNEVFYPARKAAS